MTVGEDIWFGIEPWWEGDNGSVEVYEPSSRGVTSTLSKRPGPRCCDWIMMWAFQVLSIGISALSLRSDERWLDFVNP